MQRTIATQIAHWYETAFSAPHPCFPPCTCLCRCRVWAVYSRRTGTPLATGTSLACVTSRLSRRTRSTMPSAVRRVRDLGLHTGGVQAQRPARGRRGLPGPLRRAIHQPMLRLGLQGVRPADPRHVIRRLVPGQAADPALHQALVHLILHFLDAPVLQMRAQQHAQARRGGCGGDDPGAQMAAVDVGASGLRQVVVVEQGIEPAQDRIDARGHLRHARRYRRRESGRSACLCSSWLLSVRVFSPVLHVCTPQPVSPRTTWRHRLRGSRSHQKRVPEPFIVHHIWKFERQKIGAFRALPA